MHGWKETPAKTAGETGGIGDKMATEGWGLVVIGVIEVNPVLIEFGLSVQGRSQPKPTNDIGVQPGSKECGGFMIVN